MANEQQITIEGGINLRIKCMNTEPPAPNIGLTYNIYAANDTNEVLMCVNHFESMGAAVQWAKDVMPNLRETIEYDLTHVPIPEEYDGTYR